MALTIIDALKEKGSTGGNNISEAVANLPAGGSGGGYEIIRVGTFSVSMSSNEFNKIAAAPVGYNDIGKAVREIIGSGKTILNFVIESSHYDFYLMNVYVKNNLSLIAHQKDEGFDLKDSDMFTVIYGRTYSNISSTVNFAGTLYAVCI